MAKGIEVIGLPQLQAALLRAAARTRVAASSAVAAEVKAVKDDAQDGAPVDKGELRDGIVGEARATDGTVTAPARHSGFVEHGTSKDRAQPYMAPAADRSRARFVGRVTTAVKSALGR